MDRRQDVHGGRGGHPEIAERVLDHRHAKDPAHDGDIVKGGEAAQLMGIGHDHVRCLPDEHVSHIVVEP